MEKIGRERYNLILNKIELCEICRRKSRKMNCNDRNITIIRKK